MLDQKDKIANLNLARPESAIALADSTNTSSMNLMANISTNFKNNRQKNGRIKSLIHKCTEDHAKSQNCLKVKDQTQNKLLISNNSHKELNQNQNNNNTKNNIEDNDSVFLNNGHIILPLKQYSNKFLREKRPKYNLNYLANRSSAKPNKSFILIQRQLKKSHMKGNISKLIQNQKNGKDSIKMVNFQHRVKTHPKQRVQNLQLKDRKTLKTEICPLNDVEYIEEKQLIIQEMKKQQVENQKMVQAVKNLQNGEEQTNKMGNRILKQNNTMLCPSDMNIKNRPKQNASSITKQRQRYIKPLIKTQNPISMTTPIVGMNCSSFNYATGNQTHKSNAYPKIQKISTSRALQLFSRVFKNDHIERMKIRKQMAANKSTDVYIKQLVLVNKQQYSNMQNIDRKGIKNIRKRHKTLQQEQQSQTNRRQKIDMDKIESVIHMYINGSKSNNSTNNGNQKQNVHNHSFGMSHNNNNNNRNRNRVGRRKKKYQNGNMNTNKIGYMEMVDDDSFQLVGW